MSKVFSEYSEFLSENSKLSSPMPFTQDTSVLAQSVAIASKTVPNRIVCQAMEGCDGTAQGLPDELTYRRYDRLAKGGAGMIWYEATAVMPEARANPRQLYINKSNVDVFKRHVESIKETALKTNGYEPIIIMQATHSGRYSKPNGVAEPIIAYNNPLFEKDKPLDKSCIATDEYIDKVKDALIDGAMLAEEAGFDGVDIKCCHRYLNCELLSAYNREGKYGGSFENRTRLLRESIEGAMQRCSSEFIVSTRINAYDGFPYPYGFGVKKDAGIEVDLTETIALFNILEKLGVPLINVTMGNPYVNPHVNRPFAMGGYTAPEDPLEGVARMLNGTAELKRAVPNVKIICSALSYLGVAAPGVVAAYINDNGFDFAGFGRTIFAYPDFARDIITKGKMDKSKICIACSKCSEIMRSGSTPGCVIRDKEIFAELYKKVILGKG